MALSTLRGMGPAAKEATPAVVKVTKANDVHVRQEAVQTLARIGVGDKDLVAVLLPELPTSLNTEVARALDAVDPDWRKSKHLKAGLAVIIKTLSDKDPLKRRVAAFSLGQVGPAEGVIAALEAAAKKEQDTVVKAFIDGALKEVRQKKK